jgi:hypothetical protein
MVIKIILNKHFNLIVDYEKSNSKERRGTINKNVEAKRR